jgi:hypothetical protein
MIVYLFLFFFLLMVLWFEFRASFFLSRRLPLEPNLKDFSVFIQVIRGNLWLPILSILANVQHSLEDVHSAAVGCSVL